jgi:predicted MFS family arabinose efflux permease
MLSLMFGTGIISRLSFGWIADRIGPAPALLISSSLQAASLLAYFGANGLTSLYVVTAMFGLVQGGIVPTYALIVDNVLYQGDTCGREGAHDTQPAHDRHPRFARHLDDVAER